MFLCARFLILSWLIVISLTNAFAQVTSNTDLSEQEKNSCKIGADSTGSCADVNDLMFEIATNEEEVEVTEAIKVDSMQEAPNEFKSVQSQCLEDEGTSYTCEDAVTNGPITKEVYDALNSVPLVLLPSSQNKITNKDSYRFSPKHCNCILKNNKNSIMPESEQKIYQEYKLKELGTNFANELGLFKQRFGFYELNTPEELEKSIGSKIEIEKCEIEQAFKAAKKCYAGTNFSSSVAEFLGATSVPTSKNYPENLNELLYAMDNVKLENGKMYNRKTYEGVIKSWQTGNSGAIFTDNLITSFLLDKNSRELLNDVDNQEEFINKLLIYKNKNSKAFEKELKTKLQSSKSVLRPAELDKLLKLSDSNFKKTIKSALVAFPVYDSLFKKSPMRDLFISRFDKKYSAFAKKRSTKNASKIIPSLSGFLDDDQDTIIESYSESCKELKTKINLAFCESAENKEIKSQLSQVEFSKYLVEKNVDIFKLDQSFDHLFCALPPRPAINPESSDFFRCYNLVRNPGKDKASNESCNLRKVGIISPDSQLGQSIAQTLAGSLYRPDDSVLRDIFGDSYTKYFPKDENKGANNENNQSSPYESGPKIEMPQIPETIAAPQFFPNSQASSQQKNEDNGQQIEDGEESKTASARKELEDFFDKSNDADVKDHLANLSDEQVLKLQDELQRVREKYAQDMAGLKGEMEDLKQKKEFDEKYDKLKKQYEELKDESARNFKSLAPNTASSSQNNSPSYFNPRTQIPGNSSASFGAGINQRPVSQQDKSQSVTNLSSGGPGSAMASGNSDSRKVNLTYESKNLSDNKKSGLMVLEVSEVVSGNIVNLASSDLDKYITQNGAKLDSEKLNLIASSGIIYRYKGPNNQILEKQIPYSVIDPNVKKRIQSMLKVKIIEREIKEVSYTYLVNIIDQYAKK